MDLTGVKIVDTRRIKKPSGCMKGFYLFRPALPACAGDDTPAPAGIGELKA